MKILIIPDVHGRKFWRKAIETEWDKVIFLGDYVDPYDGEAKQSEVMFELIDIVEFKRQNPDKVTLLWGNHDLFYWCKPYRKFFDYWSRHDDLRHNDIQAYFRENLDKFQWADQYENFLFTHAGLTNGFVKQLELENYNAKTINNAFATEKTQEELAKVSYYRGGPDAFGSIVWADIREHLSNIPCKEVANFFQIFGHTYARTYILTKHFAMLDTGGGYFYLDNGKLTDANGNELVKTKI